MNYRLLIMEFDIKEDAEKLFRIDVKHSNIGTSGETRTGLGLMLCKEFVEKNNGKIRVESDLKKGSRFTFTLPTGARKKQFQLKLRPRFTAFVHVNKK